MAVTPKPISIGMGGIVLILGAIFALPVSAEIFHLASGGTVEGVLLNPDQSPRTTYEVETVEGGKVVLGRTAVRKVVAFSEQLRQYEQFLPRMPDTVEGHLQMAQWCDSNSLPEQRDYHLNEIITREPDHVEARRALGYERFQGSWIIRDQWMKNQGYVRVGGAWRFPQDVTMREREQQIEDKQVEWRKQVRTWRSWLRRGGDRAKEAAIAIQKIDDPYAADALISLIEDENNAAIREVVVNALANIKTPATTMTLTKLALEDSSATVRDLAIIGLEQRDHELAVSYLVQQLTSADNTKINRAASVLERLNHPASARPLMDALVTTHKFVIQQGGDPGRTNASFGGGGGTGGLPGMSFGTPKPKTIEEDLQNQAVLRALLKVTGETVNFQYDETAWKAWYANQKIPLSIDLRRDG